MQNWYEKVRYQYQWVKNDLSMYKALYITTGHELRVDPVYPLGNEALDAANPFIGKSFSDPESDFISEQIKELFNCYGENPCPMHGQLNTRIPGQDRVIESPIPEIPETDHEPDTPKEPEVD